jgi:hypothetical protein
MGASHQTGKLSTMNHRAIVEAFERAGLEFIPANGGGAGVRFRDPVVSAAAEG